ncbi:MAG: GumC family protein [Blastocatellia bacterium]
MDKLNPPKKGVDLVEVGPTFPSTQPVYYESAYDATFDRQGEREFLRQLFSTLLKHWLMIASIVLLATGATVVYVAQQPDFYSSAARVQVNAENNPAVGGQNGSSIVLNSGSDPAYFTTQLQILESSALLRRVIKTLDLENDKAFLNPNRGRRLTALQNVQKMFGLYRPVYDESIANTTGVNEQNAVASGNNAAASAEDEVERLGPIVGKLKKRLTVTPVRDSRTKTADTRLIEIRFTHEDPVVATKIVNTIGDIYVLYNLEQKVQTNASAGDFLQKRVATLQSEIRKGEESLIDYAQKNDITSLDATQNTVVQRLTSLSGQLAQAESDRLNAETAYKAALDNQFRAAAAESNNPQVSALTGKLNDLKQKLDQLKSEYTEEWYEVVQTRKQIESVQKQLDTSRKRASDVQIAGLQEKLRETTAREKELRVNFENQRGEVFEQGEASIKYKIIQQEIDSNKGLLDNLLKRSRENDVILNGTPNNVLVADHGTVPRSADGPERFKNVMLALFVSLGFGCGLAFLLSWLDDSVHHSAEIERALEMPLLATVPAAKLSFGRRLLSGGPFGKRLKDRRNDYYDLPAFEKPQYQEAFNQLRTHLMLSRAGGPPRSILVTSGEAGEGKTMTAYNLATSLAGGSNSVLLIDGDLRCPRVNLLAGIDNKLGLTTLLTAESIDDRLISEAIQKDPYSNLNIMTAGERSINPTNLLSSNEMRVLLSKLLGRFSHIVVDSPPILYFADSMLLSTLMDSVILVVRDGVSSQQSVLKAKRVLNSVGVNISGMVVNAVPDSKTDYRNYGYYALDNEKPSNNDIHALKLN